MYNYFLHAGSVTAELRPTIWDLATVLGDIEDALNSVYSGRAAVETMHRMRWMQLNYMISKAAGDTESPQLRSDVYDWCRKEIRFSHVVDALRTRHTGRDSPWHLPGRVLGSTAWHIECAADSKSVRNESSSRTHPPTRSARSGNSHAGALRGLMRDRVEPGREDRFHPQCSTARPAGLRT
ncbi:hypothetical protein CXR26_17050 [Brevibacterium aurantiacum]|nr:hypothetical protein CXR26_17050 [Brevibacterium aurantiacum]